MFDVVIIGAGPSGLTAAIYASRRMMKALVISKNIGGQIMWTSEIENYPGIKLIKGTKLANEMYEQAKNLGVEIKTTEVKKIFKKSNDNFIIETKSERLESKTVIIAMGLEPRSLKLDKEKELLGRGISYCANCDGQFFKEKKVAVVGGGNAALDAAEVMSKIAKQVYLIYRQSQLKGFEILISKIKNKKNIKIILNSEIVQLLGKEKLEKIEIINRLKQETAIIQVDGLFVEIGHEPKTEAVAKIVDRDKLGQIIIDQNCQTSQPGVFAAGDVTQSEFKQIIIGCGQGAVAALAAYKYLQARK